MRLGRVISWFLLIGTVGGSGCLYTDRDYDGWRRDERRWERREDRRRDYRQQRRWWWYDRERDRD